MLVYQSIHPRPLQRLMVREVRTTPPQREGNEWQRKRTATQVPPEDGDRVKFPKRRVSKRVGHG